MSPEGLAIDEGADDDDDDSEEPEEVLDERLEEDLEGDLGEEDLVEEDLAVERFLGFSIVSDVLAEFFVDRFLGASSLAADARFLFLPSEVDEEEEEDLDREGDLDRLEVDLAREEDSKAFAVTR